MLAWRKMSCSGRKRQLDTATGCQEVGSSSSSWHLFSAPSLKRMPSSLKAHSDLFLTSVVSVSFLFGTSSAIR